MKKTENNVIERLRYNAKYLAVASSFGIVSSAFIPVSADDKTTQQIVGEILKFICTIFKYIGIILLAWGIGQLVLAFKNEDADSKSRAIMLIIVSIILIAIKPTLLTIIKTIEPEKEASELYKTFNKK